jgi:hypothetical protein
MTEGVDAVYTWVDGSDPSFQASLRRHAAAESTPPEKSRFRSSDELRYSLRSVLRYAPWVRRIHILTNGQTPAWLDCRDPRIHMVTHAKVFPAPERLPTFNSNAIEMCLHRIPGLSRRFLYLNDDVFLGRNVQPDEFFQDDGGQSVFVQNTLLPSDPGRGSARDRACAHTQEILTRRFGPPGEPRLLPAHCPQAYDRDILFDLEAMFEEEFRGTASHRFRRGDDLVLSVLYGYALMESPLGRAAHRRLLRGLSGQYAFLMIEGRPIWEARVLLEMLARRPAFFCVNDDLGDVPRLHPELLCLRAFLRLCFLRRSSLERSAGAERRSLGRR